MHTLKIKGVKARPLGKANFVNTHEFKESKAYERKEHRGKNIFR